MAKGGDQDPDDGDRVLSPEDLDIEDEQDVASLGDDRYVIGPDGPPSAPDTSSDSGDADEGERSPQSRAEATESEPAPDADRGDRDPTVTGRDVKQWLSNELDGHESRYAYHIAAKHGNDVAHQQLATNDVGAAFDGLLVWYARQVADGTPVDEALGILLGESGVQIRYPTACLVAYLDAHDLEPEDSIADLVSTVADEDGLAFPR